MKLADKIIRLRKQKGWSQEELAERLEVSRQSVSKWESGLSNPDLDKILSLSELFGVSTDALLKDTKMEPCEAAVSEADEPKELAEKTPVRLVERVEAERYLRTVTLLSRRFALGVMLCILSPICLICLAGAADAGMLSDGLAAGVGLGVLLAFVAVAVAIFVPNGMRLSEFEYLEKESIRLSEALSQQIGGAHSQFIPKHRLRVTVGCVICILGAVPLLVISCIQGENALAVVLCVGGLLAAVSVGVFLMVRSCYIEGAYQKLLQIGDYTVEKKKKSVWAETISTLYWLVFVALYLGVSFLTGWWHLTWIIWVVAGVLSPVIEAFLK